MPTFVVHPDGAGPFPVVLFYMDAPAMREELHEMARRIAGQGYYVLLPDLFYRFGVIRFPRRNPKARAIWRTAMEHMSNAEVMADTLSAELTEPLSPTTALLMPITVPMNPRMGMAQMKTLTIV